MARRYILLFFSLFAAGIPAFCQHRALVFMSDFGLKDGAVSAMKGVAFAVSADLRMFDITHEIPPYDVKTAAYRLIQAAPYWPKGTVFVCVVDPGVGSNRKSVVLKTKSGHYVVSPDNGTLTLIADFMGIEEVREIDETKNRRKDSEASYTFHGRDVYAYTGARLAAGVMPFEEVGASISHEVVRFANPRAQYQDGKITGSIPVLDVQFGNIWTNIDSETFGLLGIAPGDSVHVQIFHKAVATYNKSIVYGRTFSDVTEGQEIAYQNSLLNFSIGVNAGSFADRYHILGGTDWVILLRKGK